MVATRTVKTVQQFVHTEPDGAVLYIQYVPYSVHNERILGSKLTCPMNRRTHPEKKWSFKAPMSLKSGKSRLVWWVEVDATLGMGGRNADKEDMQVTAAEPTHHLC